MKCINQKPTKIDVAASAKKLAPVTIDIWSGANSETKQITTLTKGVDTAPAVKQLRQITQSFLNQSIPSKKELRAIVCIRRSVIIMGLRP